MARDSGSTERGGSGVAAVASAGVLPGRAGHGWQEDGAGWYGVVGIQCARILAALVEVVRERGVGRVTVAHVVARAGVSRRTFYELFDDCEACYLAAFDEAVRRAALRVVPAFDHGKDWQGRLRAGLQALLEFIEDEPGLGVFCMVDALGGGPSVLARRGEIVELLVDAVDAGRRVPPRAAGQESRPPRLTAEGLVGGVLGVLHARLVNERQGQGEGTRGLSSLLGPLMGMIVLPYRGAAAAARELARPAPKRRRAPRPPSDPLRELDMRLTYRTVRVLVAIAARPGASNREIANASGVQDQGQISKLLARLGHLGLIENRGAGSGRGEPNAWFLTARGVDVERTLHEQGATAVH